jgi:hypothetical protein
MPTKLLFISFERKGRVEVQRAGRIRADKSRETLIEHYFLDGAPIEKTALPEEHNEAPAAPPARSSRRRAASGA